MLELRLIPQTSKNNLGSKPGIPRIKRSGVLQQQVRRIPALSNLLQNIESN
jgi:hypothetical protein